MAVGRGAGSFLSCSLALEHRPLPVGAGIGFYLAELQRGRGVAGPHVELLVAVGLEVGRSGAGKHLDDAEVVVAGLGEPQLDERPEFGADHTVERLGKVIFEAIGILSLERLAIVLDAERNAGVVHAEHEVPALRVQERGDGLHGGLFDITACFADLIIEP